MCAGLVAQYLFVFFDLDNPKAMTQPNRRRFLQLASAALAATVITPNQLLAGGQAAALPLGSSYDEAYWQMLRKHFPLKKELIYLNNGTMGPSPYYVIEQTHKGMMEADAEGNYGGWEGTCKKLAAFIGANDDEIALTRNVTEGINIVCNGLLLKAGDEVIVTTHEHGGNAFPWLNLAQRKGIVLKPFVPAATAAENLQRITALMGKKTKVIAVPHVLCTQGQVLPAQAISKLGRERGVFVFIDGAHGPGMMSLNLHEMGCDAYASCCHKWMLGPKGTGFLYIRKEAMEQVHPIFVGAGSDNAKWSMATTPPVMGDFAAGAHRYYAGTFNMGLYKGVQAAIEFIDSIGIEQIYARVTSLADYTRNHLKSMPHVQVITPDEPESRGAITGFRIIGIDAMGFYEEAAKAGVRIRMVHENGLNSLRVSTHIYNNTQEVDRLLELVSSKK